MECAGKTHTFKLWDSLIDTLTAFRHPMSCPPLVGHVGNASVALSGLGTKQSYIPCLWVPSGLRCVLAVYLLGFPLCLCMVSVAQAALGKLRRCVGFCDCQAAFDCSRANWYNYLTTAGLPKHMSWLMNLACCPSIMSKNPTGCFGLLGWCFESSCRGLSESYFLVLLQLVLHHLYRLP